MNKTPLQIAEELARKCAIKCCYAAGIDPDYENNINAFLPATEPIPLVELLECARLLKSCEWIGALLTSDTPPLLGEISQALFNLDKRL